MAKRDYQGLLFIGDPHLASRVPGFRKDDYPRVIARKLAWCMDQCREHALLPVLLGDLFHHPRDNANWLLGEILDILGHQPVVGIHGNHDVRENALTDDDSLAVIVRAGRLHLVDRDGPWSGTIAGRPVVVGGTSWMQRLPTAFPSAGNGLGNGAARPLTFWIAHHDVKVPGYEEQGRFSPQEIPGIDVVVNGHIHRQLPEVQAGSTLWLTPGNITRIARADATKLHTPAVLQVLVTAEGYQRQMLPVPHEPFEAVFHEALADPAVATTASAFVQGLAELKARRTASGAGLMEFLKANLGQFEEPVSAQIRLLAQEVTTHGDTQET